MSDEVKLLPCPTPWCKGEGEVRSYGGFQVICQGNGDAMGCSVETHEFATPEEAMTAWNTRPPIGTDEVVGPSLGAIPGSHPADQAPSGRGASRFDPERVQKAFRDRLTVYAAKMEKADPFAEDDANRHERYKFAIECFEYFAHEAGLDFPPELASERTEA